MRTGWYYLHVNGDLIYKADHADTAADIRESDLARGMWPLDVEDRETAWRIAVEAGAAGAKPERIKELAEKWKLTDDDAANYAQVLHCDLFMDGKSWCVTGPRHRDLQQDQAGFGDTALEAFIDLCKNLGYQPSKTWGRTFKDYLQQADPNNSQFGVGA